MNPNIKTFFFWAAIGLLLMFPLFAHLDTLVIRIWDEARLAENAYQMYHNGNYIVTYCDNEPEMWNTKPPLMIWLQVLFIKMIGVNELAIRLPAAIAGLLTCLALYYFLKKYLQNTTISILAILVLITTNGYVQIHITRTGDYDALLILFTTIAALSYFFFIEHKKTKWLYCFFIMMGLAVLTKSIAGLMITPGLLLYTIWRRKLLSVLKSKHFYFGILLFIAISVPYYIIREQLNPGYWEAVKMNELGGRFLTTIENHDKNFFHYFDWLLNHDVLYWLLFVVFGIVYSVRQNNLLIKRITLFSVITSLSFLLIISSSKTKLDWYAAPTYPFLAIISAIGIYGFILFLVEKKWFFKNMSKRTFIVVISCLILIGPYIVVVYKVTPPREKTFDVEMYEITYYLKNAVKNKHDISNQIMLYDGYNYHNQFYLHLLQAEGKNVVFQSYDTDLRNKIVFTQQENIKTYITNTYQYDTLNNVGNIVTYQLYGYKTK